MYIMDISMSIKYSENTFMRRYERRAEYRKKYADKCLCAIASDACLDILLTTP